MPQFMYAQLNWFAQTAASPKPMDPTSILQIIPEWGALGIVVYLVFMFFKQLERKDAEIKLMLDQFTNTLNMVNKEFNETIARYNTENAQSTREWLDRLKNLQELNNKALLDVHVVLNKFSGHLDAVVVQMDTVARGIKETADAFNQAGPLPVKEKLPDKS